MKVLNCLVILTFLFNGGSALANWRDDNPNKPNGYEASMLRYHYGTPDEDTHNGYRATEARARNGLDIYAPPSKDDGWNNSGGEGNSRFGGGGYGRSNGLWGSHFRQGQAEGEEYWKQRLQNRMPPSNMPINSGGSGYAGQQQMSGQMPAYQRMPAGQQGSWQSQQAGGNAQWPMQANQIQGGNVGYPMNRFSTGYNQAGINSCANYQYSPYNSYGVNSTALRSAVAQRPIGTLLRNSQGGFNRIYTGQ